MKILFSTWFLLPLTVVFAYVSVQTREIAMILATLFWGGLFVLTLLLRRTIERNKKLRELHRGEMKRWELEDFTSRRPRLQELLATGQLSRLEEWWEDDEIWIEENSHLRFTFINGEEMDFILHLPIARELSALLATQGISWQSSYRATHSSRTIWPPDSPMANEKLTNKI